VIEGTNDKVQCIVRASLSTFLTVMPGPERNDPARQPGLHDALLRADDDRLRRDDGLQHGRQRERRLRRDRADRELLRPHFQRERRRLVHHGAHLHRTCPPRAGAPRTRSRAVGRQFIKIWFFPRNAGPPGAFQSATGTVDTSTLGTPTAFFPNTNCNIDGYFAAQNIIFDLTLCGQWAGAVFNSDGCSGNCVGMFLLAPASRDALLTPIVQTT
jgi:hypothetical protein